MIVKEIDCKSILTKSGIEGVDYAINPYVGCSHVGGKIRRLLEKHYPGLVEGYRHIAANRKPYHDALMAKARMLAEKHGLAWGG